MAGASKYIESKSRWPGIQKRGGIPIETSDRSFMVSRDLHARFENDFPLLDMSLELMKLRKWTRKNPEKRVPREAVFGLIRSWLKRADARRIRDEYQRIGEADE